MARPQVVIVGAGFAGLSAARRLRKAAADVTLIDRTNHHLFQPLLYEVATAGLTAPDIASPVRQILKGQANLTVLMGEVQRVDRSTRQIYLRDGTLCYDYLVVATGMVNSYFGNDDWARYAPGLKSLDDALTIRNKVLLAYETAERIGGTDARQSHWLTFVVVGGGPTGVELAGALVDIARYSMTRNFRSFDPRTARVVLLEGSDRVLSTYPRSLSDAAERQLRELGVELRTNARVSRIDAEGVDVAGERIASHTVLWAAGLRASPLVQSLGAEVDAQGRAYVADTLTLESDDRVAVVGDATAIRRQSAAIPGIAPAAMQMGRHAASNILRDIEGEQAQPFVYRHRGMMATVGRRRAVADLGKLRFSGFFAWLLWVTVHLFFIADFRNRIAAFFNWFWAYITFQRRARVVLPGTATTSASTVAQSEIRRR